jgi:hypothetical protein
LRDYNTANPPVALQTGGNLYLGTDANNGGQISAAKIGINGAVDAGQVATFNGKIGASAISTGGLTTSDSLAVNQASVDSGQVATFNGEIGVKGLATGGSITGGSIDGTTLKQSGTAIFANDVDIFKSYVASQHISSSRTGTSSGARVGKVVRLGPNFKYFAHSETVLTNDLANNGLATVGKFDPQTNAGGLNWFVNFYGKGSSAQDETNQILTGVYGGGGFLYIWVKNVSGAVRSIDGIVILWTVDFV